MKTVCAKRRCLFSGVKEFNKFPMIKGYSIILVGN